MFVGVCVPRVEARDLRPEVPPEQSLVISSGHKASFLMLDVSCLPACRAWPGLACCCNVLVPLPLFTRCVRRHILSVNAINCMPPLVCAASSVTC